MSDRNTHGGGRVGALDSVRGLAAVLVVFHHCLIVFPALGDGRTAAAHIAYSFPLRILSAGQGAVLLFFMLSGVVLALTYLGKDGRAYKPYAIKRFARIYLPFATAIMLAAALASLVGVKPLAWASPWFNSSGWHTPVTASLIGAHLLMFRTIELDNVMWSLIYEMRISLAFPLIALAVERRWASALVGFTLLAVAALISLRWVGDRPVLADVAFTAQLVPLFAAGAAIAVNRGPITAKLSRAQPAVRLLLWAIALTLLSYTPVDVGFTTSGLALGRVLVSGCAAALVIALALGGGGGSRRILEHGVSKYLGRISYSLYLMHLIVIEVTMRTLTPFLPSWAALAFVIPTSIAVAHVFNLAVERPTIRFGRWLAVKATGRVAVGTDGADPPQSPPLDPLQGPPRGFGAHRF